MFETPPTWKARFLYLNIPHEVRWGYLRLIVSQSVSQSVSMSWYRAPLWDLRPDITSCRNVVWNLRSCFCGAPSLTRGRVCNSYNNSYISIWHQTESKRPDWVKGRWQGNMQQKIVVKHSQIGTMTQMEVIIYATNLSYTQISIVH
jgi:hypothetical protein